MSPTHPLLPRGLYGMADQSQGDPVALGTWLFENGVKVVQLRAKQASHETLNRMARTLVAVARARGGLLLINDNVAVAHASGAHGVHLGQDDGDLAHARRLLGPGAILGRSTHTTAHLSAAIHADYVGFGPIYGTKTKSLTWSPRGLAALRHAVATSPVPVVAIGGITADRLPELRATGVHGWAVVAGLWGASDRQMTLRTLQGLT